MGLRRLIATMSCLAAAGVAMSRPDDVVGAMNGLTEFISPLYAQSIQQAPKEPTALPVTGSAQPVKESSEAAAAQQPGPTAATLAPSTNASPEKAATQLPNYAPVEHSLTFKTAPTTNTAAAQKPKSDTVASTGDKTEVAPSTMVPSVSAPSSSATSSTPGNTAKPDKKKARTAVITIEADPRLTGALTKGKPSAHPIIPAKQLFGAAKVPSSAKAQVFGYYSHGCLAGGMALPIDGPAWEVMRLSRNRNWAHPRLVKLVERLASESQKDDGWPGLLVGDLAQPRGGPMLTGHASHQVGLDADVWLTPMPKRRLTRKEREELEATSMLDGTEVAVDPKVFTEGQVKLIKRAASYPEVERIFVHPAIKKALCDAAGTDRGWLSKVRPLYGHYYHFHIRIGCPPGSSATCKSQTPVANSDGCGKEVKSWLARVIPRKGPPPPQKTPPKPKPQITLAQLPSACSAVLESGPQGVAIPEGAKAATARAHKSRGRKAHVAKH
jgi:penicillin-insensitive murein endopeptidase